MISTEGGNLIQPYNDNNIVRKSVSLSKIGKTNILTWRGGGGEGAFCIFERGGKEGGWWKIVGRGEKESAQSAL